MRFGFASPVAALLAARANPINLTADDSEDDFEEAPPPRVPRLTDSDRTSTITNANTTTAITNNGQPGRSRKRALEFASRPPSRADSAVSSSDESDAGPSRQRRGRPNPEQNGGGGGFLPPTPVRTVDRSTKPGELNFFFNTMDRQRSLLEQGSLSSPSPGRSPDGKRRDLMDGSICAGRTLICGQRFGRCELLFGEDRMRLTLWYPAVEKRRWRGHIKYKQLERLSLSSAERAPYLLLMELASSETSDSSFAELFDPLFAQWSQDHPDSADSQLYGAVFYFDEQLDYVRCRSAGEAIPALRHFFQRPIPESEALRLAKLVRLRDRDRERDQRFWRQDAIRIRSESSAAVLANEERDDSPFESTEGSQERDSNGSVSATATPPVESPTVNLSEETKEDLPPSSSSEDSKTVILIKSQDQSQSSASSGEATSTAPTTKDDRRHQIILRYPYDDSDSVGRVSVTNGDVKRLAPGEFLNDNIIDFYLRFLWRHVEPWHKLHLYFFSSYFFTQLNANKGPRDRSPATADERFARVARWTQKETNLFDKHFLFIPINDSFHWSVAVVCNPGSAIVTKRRTRSERKTIAAAVKATEIAIDVEDPYAHFRASARASSPPVKAAAGTTPNDDGHEFSEEEVEEFKPHRREFPPCILFLDSLRCHRKKKFSDMIRDYLECEWKARFNQEQPAKAEKSENDTTSDGTIDRPASVDDDDEDASKSVSFVTSFDRECIRLIEPNIPRQSNSSDCGVFLLMYAMEIVRRFPGGLTQEDAEANLSASLSPDMFGDEHVLEFREYLHQLIFCLRSLQERGITEDSVKDEGLEWFTSDR